jgi:DNA-binding transcriptional regulator YiaG
MGEVSEQEGTLIATGVHVQVVAQGIVLTRAVMRLIAARVMQEMGYERIIIAGAVRTSGAGKGRRPRPLGFPEIVLLQPGDATVAVITASHALARRGISLLRAKRAIEAMLAQGKTILALPTVEDAASLRADLADAGVQMTLRSLPQDERNGNLTQRLPALRARLAMTQEQFALQFGFELKTLRGWEQGRRADMAVLSYLRLIDKEPETVARIADQA